LKNSAIIPVLQLNNSSFESNLNNASILLEDQIKLIVLSEENSSELNNTAVFPTLKLKNSPSGSDSRSSQVVNSQLVSYSNEDDLQPNMFLENDDLEYGSSSEKENSIFGSSVVEATFPSSSSPEEFTNSGYVIADASQTSNGPPTNESISENDDNFHQNDFSVENNNTSSTTSTVINTTISTPQQWNSSSSWKNSINDSSSMENETKPNIFSEETSYPSNSTEAIPSLQLNSSSNANNSNNGNSSIEAEVKLSILSENNKFQFGSSSEEMKSPSDNTLQPINTTVVAVPQFSSSFTGLALAQIILASEKGSPQNTLPHHTSSIAEASKASKSTAIAASQSGLSSKDSVLVWNSNTKGKNTQNNFSSISNTVKNPAGTTSTSSQKTQAVNVTDYSPELPGSETQRELKSKTKYISKTQYYQDLKTGKYPSQKSSQAAVQTGGLSKTYYQRTNNGNDMYQSFNKQTKSFMKPKEYLKYNAMLPVNAQMQERSYDTTYRQFNSQEYQQPYMDNNIQEYQQPFQGWIDTAQEYRQPYQGSNFQYQYSQTSGVKSGFVPAWKTSYTPVSGNGGCYNKCRPDCNEYLYGGFCKQSCQTACNILPTCGIKNNVQYTGQTMVCGRQGYNSEEIINSYYSTRPMNLK
jgi:hypothetical protein